jgi:hypothetical protein
MQPLQGVALSVSDRDPLDNCINGPDPVSAITRDFSDTAQTLFSASDVRDTLAQVVELAVSTIDGCDFAGLLLVEGGVVSTFVLTIPFVVEVHALQHQGGGGPCIDAVSERTAIRQLLSRLSDYIGKGPGLPR